MGGVRRTSPPAEQMVTHAVMRLKTSPAKRMETSTATVPAIQRAKLRPGRLRATVAERALTRAIPRVMADQMVAPRAAVVFASRADLFSPRRQTMPKPAALISATARFGPAAAAAKLVEMAAAQLSSSTPSCAADATEECQHRPHWHGHASR